MIEFLEIPQLLNNCIRTYYYNDAIMIFDFVSKFCDKHSNYEPVFKVNLSLSKFNLRLTKVCFII